MNEERWRHNFPTGFLSSFVDRVTPEPVAVIEPCDLALSESHLARPRSFHPRIRAAFRPNVRRGGTRQD
jgi:hypothetical protein